MSRPLDGVACLDELLDLTAELLPKAAHRGLTAARERIVEDSFNLAVLGEFKRGKSTLVNALLGRDVLPTGTLPLTSVVTMIRFGEQERLIVEFENGRREARTIDELAGYVTEERNPANRLGVDHVSVLLTDELLRSGLVLVDTPGIGSIHTHNSELARGFLAQVDAALCVLDAGQPLSSAELELFDEVAIRVPRLIAVLNKLDHLEHDERSVTKSFVRSKLADSLPRREIELFALSARTREGIQPLLDRLRMLADDERRLLLVRSVARLASDAARDGAQSARFEAHAIAIPLDQLVRHIHLFEERIDSLRIAGSEASDLLERGVQRSLQRLVNEPLTAYASAETPGLRRLVREHLAGIGKLAPRELSRDLERWIDATIRDRFEALAPDFEAAVARELAELEERYAGQVQRILEQLQEAAEDVFGARAAELLPTVGLRTPSKFSFKLEDPEHALDILVGFGRTVTPGALGRRLVVRDAEQRLIDMTDRHAGRLRSELVERASSAARQYGRELAATIEEAIEAILRTIERAAEKHRLGELRAQARLATLAANAARCEQLADMFDGWVASPGELPAASCGASQRAHPD